MIAVPAPLRDRGFRLFFSGEVVNNAGTSMANLALAFAVLGIDDSATAVGWVAAAWTVRYMDDGLQCVRPERPVSRETQETSPGVACVSQGPGTRTSHGRGDAH